MILGEDGSQPPVTGEVDLNQANHAMSRLPMGEYCKAVREYMRTAAKESEFVVDGITGNQLRTMDQLVELELKDISVTILEPEPEDCLLPEHKTAVTLGETLTNLDDAELRQNGRFGGLEILVKAGAGTGKTWLTYQLLATMTRQDPSVPESACFVPLLVRVQRLATAFREQRPLLDEAKKDLLTWYIEYTFEAAERDMLLDAYDRRVLVLILDGVDEASDLKGLIHDFVLNHMWKKGHRLLVTSRPEGVQSIEHLSGGERVVNNPTSSIVWKQFSPTLDLKSYTREQQQAVLHQQV